MFFRLTKDLNFFKIKWKYYLDYNENNLKYKTHWAFIKLRNEIGEENYKYFSMLIFKKWIAKNFSYTQMFIHRFYKYSKKLQLEFNNNEKQFIYYVEEVNFTLWRTLKTVPIRLELADKEKCHFTNKNVTVHIFSKESKPRFYVHGTLVLTNKRLIIESSEVDENNQPKIYSFELLKLKNITNSGIGVTFFYSGFNYLIRENNKVLIFALLYRVLGKKKVNFNLNELPTNFSFFPQKEKKL